jgi:hypothetical protein
MCSIKLVQEDALGLMRKRACEPTYAFTAATMPCSITCSGTTPPHESPELGRELFENTVWRPVAAVAEEKVASALALAVCKCTALAGIAREAITARSTYATIERLDSCLPA